VNIWQPDPISDASNSDPGRSAAGQRTHAPVVAPITSRRQQLLLVGVTLIPLALFAISAWQSWQSAWHAAEIEATRTAEAAAEYAQRLLEAQLLRIERANDVLERLTDAEIRVREAELHSRLRQVTNRAPVPASNTATPGFYLFVYDRNSLPLVSSTLLPVPATRPALDRDFARILASPEAPAIHVGPLHTGRDTGRQFFSVFARREATGNDVPTGAYDGAIAASIYIDTVSPVLHALTSRPGMVVILFRADGAVLARSIGRIEGVRSRASPGSPVIEAVGRGEEQGAFRATLDIDGVERAMAFRVVGGGWPVLAVAARRRPAIMSEWQREILPQAALAVASSLLLLLLAWSVIRRKREIEATNRQLEQRVAERTQRLTERERLLSLAQQAASAACWSWNPTTNEVWWSLEMFQLLGLDPTHDAAIATSAGFTALVHPDDRAKFKAAHEEALASGVLGLEFRVLQARPGGREIERYFLSRAQLVPTTEIGGKLLVGIDVDVTDRKRADERFEAATAAMEGFVYEWDLNTGCVARGPGVVAVLGEEPPPTGEAWMERMHPEDRAAVETELRACFAVPSRHRYVLEYRVRRADGTWAWVLDRGRIVRSAGSGLVLRAMGGAVDITVRRIAEERQQLLMREVDHRGKNALAVVRAALRLTREEDAAAYRAAIEGRVDALARAQSLLAETGWRGSNLRHLLEQTLQPFVAVVAAPRAVLAGPDVELSAAATQPLSMLFHELATNATKYGALSASDGILRVAWMMDGHALHVRWDEGGGPTGKEKPTRKGFGSRVVDATARGQLGGEVTWHWLQSGLVVELALPLERILAAAADGQASDVARPIY
jgi:two-component sensor histidine kinase